MNNILVHAGIGVRGYLAGFGRIWPGTDGWLHLIGGHYASWYSAQHRAHIPPPAHLLTSDHIRLTKGSHIYLLAAQEL